MYHKKFEANNNKEYIQEHQQLDQIPSTQNFSQASPYLERLRQKARSKNTCDPKDYAELVYAQYTNLLEKSKQLCQQYESQRKARIAELTYIAQNQQNAISCYTDLLQVSSGEIERWFNKVREDNFQQESKDMAEKFISRLKKFNEKFKVSQKKYESLNLQNCVQELRRQNQELRLRVNEPKRTSRTQYIEKQMEKIKQEFEVNIAQALKKKKDAQEETSRCFLALREQQQQISQIKIKQCPQAVASLIITSIRSYTTILESANIRQKMFAQEYNHLNDLYYERILKTFSKLLIRDQESIQFLRFTAPKLRSSRSASL